jgi:hypothetical protein
MERDHMGLALWIGYHWSSELDDEEARREALQEEFAPVNAIRRATGLPEHHEPMEPRDGAPWMQIIGSYSCIHYLRRIAAYLALGQGLPEPTLEDPTDDPVFRQYYAASRMETRAAPYGSEPQPRLPIDVPLPTFMVAGGLPFAHLMHHSDYDGYYLPISFPEVLVPHPRRDTASRYVGSASVLRKECEELAERLGLPGDIELQELAQMRQHTPALAIRTGWERYLEECFVCKALLTGAEISIGSACALRFG